MPEQDTDVLEVLIGQMAKCRDINRVLSEALGVLGHAELFESVRNLVAWVMPCGFRLSELPDRHVREITNTRRGRVARQRRGAV